MASVIEQLLVYPDRMKKNLDSMGGLVFSQRVLLALTQAGIPREDAYRIVQKNAMEVWDSDGEKSFAELLKVDADVSSRLKSEDIDVLFTTEFYTAQIEKIFNI